MPGPKHFEIKSQSESPKDWISPSVQKHTLFQLGKSHGRRYVRIELSSPIQFRLLEYKKEKLKLSNDRIAGEILNLSEGGVLLATDRSVPDDGFVLLTLSLNNLVTLEGVLGKIKRVESSGDGDFLLGVEFVSREDLEKLSSPEEIDSLPVKVASFDQKLKKIVTSYLRTAELTTRA